MNNLLYPSLGMSKTNSKQSRISKQSSDKLQFNDGFVTFEQNMNSKKGSIKNSEKPEQEILIMPDFDCQLPLREEIDFDHDKGLFQSSRTFIVRKFDGDLSQTKEEAYAKLQDRQRKLNTVRQKNKIQQLFKQNINGRMSKIQINLSNKSLALAPLTKSSSNQIVNVKIDGSRGQTPDMRKRPNKENKDINFTAKSQSALQLTHPDSPATVDIHTKQTPKFS